jgi:lipid-binding SYLF domain-containing protein
VTYAIPVQSAATLHCPLGCIFTHSVKYRFVTEIATGLIQGLLMKITFLSLLLLFAGVTACSTMTAAEKQQKRNALNQMAETTVTALSEKSPEILTKIKNGLAYAVANMKLTKVPIVGAGGGEGVFIDNDTQLHTYFTVSRFDVGGGWGARSYKILLIVESQQVYDRMKDGTWEFQAGAEASAGSVSAEGSSSDLVNKGFSTYVLSDGGASATVTARMIHIKINRELTEQP